MCSATSAQFLVDLRAANDSLRLCGVDTSVTEECGLEIGVVLTAEAAIERVQNDDTSALLIIPRRLRRGPGSPDSDQPALLHRWPT
jgi:hypothetical protein